MTECSIVGVALHSLCGSETRGAGDKYRIFSLVNDTTDISKRRLSINCSQRSEVTSCKQRAEKGKEEEAFVFFCATPNLAIGRGCRIGRMAILYSE